MPTIQEVIQTIEAAAPPIYQEQYDNAQLITGPQQEQCTGALLTLDAVEEVIDEAIEKECNLVIAHHPIVFKGLKRLTGANYIERTIIKAIKNDVAIYACHTNLDNVAHGVNAKICEKLGIQHTRVLAPKEDSLLHLSTFVPHDDVETVRKALFKAGAGHIGNYDACSFNVSGEGTFRANEHANPTKGSRGNLHTEPETRVEVVLPIHQKRAVVTALKSAHPYEEVAFYLTKLMNTNPDIGSGMIGNLPQEQPVMDFLQSIKEKMNTPLIRYTSTKAIDRVKTVAVCGGAGRFLLPKAISSGADVFITADVKYHEFFDADNQLVLADIGHFESEQFTNELFAEIIQKKFSNFAVHFSMIKTNPINYL